MGLSTHLLKFFLFNIKKLIFQFICKKYLSRFPNNLFYKKTLKPDITFYTSKKNFILNFFLFLFIITKNLEISENNEEDEIN